MRQVRRLAASRITGQQLQLDARAVRGTLQSSPAPSRRRPAPAHPCLPSLLFLPDILLATFIVVTRGPYRC